MKTAPGLKKINITATILNNKALIILILLGVAMSLGTENFFSFRNLMNVTRQICVSAIIGLGFTYVLTSGSIDLSVGRMLGMVGVVMGLMSRAGVPFLPTVLAGVALGAFCGFLNGIITVGLNLNPFIVTLATQQVFKGMCNIFANNTTIGNIDPMFKAIGQGYWLQIPIPIYIMVALALLMWLVLNRTSFGRHIVALGGNAEAARVSGVNTSAVRVKVYVVMGLCVALAAIVMNGRLDSAQPTAGQDMEMDSIAAVVLGGTMFTGGVGKPVGTIFGCMIIGVINNGLNLMNVNTNWQLVVKGVIIVLAMILDTKSESILARSTMRKAAASRG